MHLYHFLLWHALITFAHCIEFCPSGSLVIAKELKPEDEDAATSAHNRVRQRLVDGAVPGQPRAKYMNTMVYDQTLARKAMPVSRQCANIPMYVKDRRWPCVGQNIYLACSKDFDVNGDWDEAVDHWFSENQNFVYPSYAVNNQDVSHYRQLAWANMDSLGCDYFLFLSTEDITKPFCKMYTCNYGFCANSQANADLAPYEAV